MEKLNEEIKNLEREIEMLKDVEDFTICIRQDIEKAVRNMKGKILLEVWK